MTKRNGQDAFSVSLKDSIATKLLRYVFSIYLVVSIIVTVIHMVSEYQRVRENIVEDIKIIHLNSNPTMAIALWEADIDQMTSILNGMVKSPTILGVKISDLSGRYKLEAGQTIPPGNEITFPEEGQTLRIKARDSDLFGYRFPIINTTGGEDYELGSMTIFSSSAVIFSRVQSSYFFIVINAIIKTIVLWVVFLWVSRFLLRRPLSALTSAAEQIELENLENIQIDVDGKEKNELTILADTLKAMIQKLLKARRELYKSKEELEVRVSERTAELKQAFARLKSDEEALKQAKQDADAANRAKSLFLANMSHELRTPLNVILGFAQLLNRDTGLSTEQAAGLATISQSGMHLQALINDVLELSKIEVGRIELNPEPFDLQKVLLGLEEMFRLRAGQKGLDLKFLLDKGLPRQVRADKNKLRQVLINLLGNAVKFTDQGSVSLRIECLGGKGPAGCSLMRFTVADTGVGIAEKNQARIFEAFYQADDRGRAHQGTGLGLAISHSFVTLLGGELKVSSKAGCGTSFTFDLPVDVIPEEQAESVRPGRVVGLVDGGPEYRLLVAEDHPDNRMLMATLLRSVGFTVQEAANGREALDIWQEWRPHLIWMDIRMPEMDGLDAIRAIRRLPGGDQPLIIGLTAFAFEEDRQMFMAAGGNDFVRKPCTEEMIFNCLEKHLGVHFQYAEYDHHLSDGTCTGRLEHNEVSALLEALPGTLLSRFDEAVRQSDVAGIEQGIEEICQAAPQLGQFFRKLAADFAYDEIAGYLDEKRC